MWNNCERPDSKCVYQLIRFLKIFANEYDRINIHLENVQKEFKQSTDSSETQKEARAPEVETSELQMDVEKADSTTECFKKRIEALQKQRQEIVQESKKCLHQFVCEKTKFIESHHKAIHYLKACAAQSNHPMAIADCEKNVNEINKDLAHELFYIQKLEDDLGSFLLFLNESKAKTDEDSDFKTYDCIAPNPLQDVSAIANEIRYLMGTALRKAFAHLHIHRPVEESSFFAQYLMHMKHNEERMKNKWSVLQ